jgi:chemotaxis protein histidine kinase CheA
MSKRNFSLIVTKRPRDEPIVDEPINFPPLGNLHLELLENKNKVKPGLPDIISPAKKTVIEEKKKPVVKENVEKKETSAPPVEKKELHAPTTIEKQEKIKEEIPKKKEEVKKEKPKKLPVSDSESEAELLSLEELIDDEEENAELSELEEVKSDDSEDDDAADSKEEEEEEEEEEESPKKEEEKEEEDEYAGLSPEERERREKEEYMWRFRILKKKFKNPSVEIPEFNEHSELNEMKSVYERTTKELYLDNCVDSYRTYLMGGFMMVEFVCTNWLGVDLGGFTSSQTRMMYKYDMLLIELGEKSYSNWGAKIPVEIRLAGLILLQAGLFYLGKIISSKYGSGMADVFRGFTGQPPNSDDKIKDEPVKKKMKGPRFRAEDIREMSHVKKME